VRALVTGSKGFIGQHLVRELFKLKDCSSIVGVCRSNKDKHVKQFDEIKNQEYREVYCDIEDERQVNLMMHTYRPDIVFHLAGNPNTKLAEDDKDGAHVWRTNAGGTHNLLAHCPDGCRFVLASSATVYGALGEKYRACEDHPTVPTSHYGSSKLAAESLVNTYTSLGKIRGLILRYVAAVGSGSTHGIVHDFIRKLRGPSVTLDVLGDHPGSTKPFIYVKDMVRATIQLGLAPVGGVWNVSTNNSITVEDVALATMHALGIHKEVNFLGKKANWAGDNNIVRVSNCKLRKFGWQPQFLYSGEAIRHAVLEIAGVS
jgi:UDP-glucose 4-epimerase